jgi:hypothetical protein
MANTVKATINGQTYTLEYNSNTGKYEAEITAPSDSSYEHNAGHYFPVSISATDEAGNITTISDTEGDFKENLKLYVKEQIKPTIANISPSSDAYISNSNPTIEFDVLDNSNGQETGFSGVNPDSIVLTVGGKAVSASAIIRTPITGGYKCSYTPTDAISDGDCTITIAVSDYDGNTSDTATATFTVDTKPPVLNVTYPSDELVTNETEIEITGVTSDANSSPVMVEIEVNGTSQGYAEVSGDGSFSKKVTLTEGVNIITVIALDKSDYRTTVTRTITLNTQGLAFKTVEISPNPVNCGKTYTISVTFVE